MAVMGDEKSALQELFDRAGLELVGGHGRVVDAHPVAAAWRPVVAGSAEPTITVPGDHPDLVAELNRQWHQLAVEHEVINAEGEFLISVANQSSCCDYGHWTRVRLAKHWDLAGLLGPKPGQPEFVAMSLDGGSVLGSTTEEYAVWFVVVSPFAQWLEASAQAQAVEGPEERETGWGTFLPQCVRQRNRTFK